MSTRPVRVLLIEDNPTDRRLIQARLRAAGTGFEPMPAPDLTTALALLADRQFDVVLSDLSLPETEGLETLRRVQAIAVNLPIVVLTGMEDEALAIDAVRAGAQDYLMKQCVDHNVLSRTLRHAIERKCIETALRTSEDRFRRLFEASTDAVCVTTLDGQMTDVNGAAVELFGYTREELLAMNAADLYARPEENPGFVRDLIAQGVLRDCPARLRRSDGTELEAMLNASVQRDDAGNASAFHVTVRDQTARRKLEQELSQAQKLESVGRLAAGIAHEINTPTQYVSDNVRFLQDAFRDIVPLLAHCRGLRQALTAGSVPAELRREFEDLLDGADLDFLVGEVPQAVQQSLDGLARVAEIVRAMKEFSHPGQKERMEIDINRALTSTITVARNEWKYVADLQTDFAPDLPPVHGLPGELNQVFLNIIVNAAHAIAAAPTDAHEPVKGTIRVTTRRALDEGVEISIGDTGTGIPAEILDNIFEPFFTTKEVGKGTGQGLAIARSVVVDKHQGRIRLETQVGAGTTFFIWLPVGSLEEAGDRAGAGDREPCLRVV